MHRLVHKIPQVWFDAIRNGGNPGPRFTASYDAKLKWAYDELKGLNSSQRVSMARNPHYINSLTTFHLPSF